MQCRIVPRVGCLWLRCIAAHRRPAGRGRAVPARRQQRAADRDRRRRHPHHLVPSPPYRRRHHHHLQAQRPLRRGRAEEARLVHARLAARRIRPHGSASVRSVVGDLSRGRRHASRSRWCAAIARRRPTPCCARARPASRSSASTRTARPWISTFPACRWRKSAIVGLRLQRGGVGFYPTSGSPFVHLDTGTIRHWPRMTHEQLAKVFPDGRTVHIPSDGQPLPGYALALADVERRGGMSVRDFARSRARGRRDHRQHRARGRKAEAQPVRQDLRHRQG